MELVFAISCRKPGADSYFTFVVETEAKAQRIYRMLLQLGSEKLLDPERVCVVVAWTGEVFQVAVAISAGDDHDEIIGTIQRECKMRLSLHPDVWVMDELHADVEAFVLLTRASNN